MAEEQQNQTQKEALKKLVFNLDDVKVHGASARCSDHLRSIIVMRR